jgi:hypothetical protein
MPTWLLASNALSKFVTIFFSKSEIAAVQKDSTLNTDELHF